MFAERNSTTSLSVNKLYVFWQMSDFLPSNLTHLFRQLINFNKRWFVTCVRDCDTSSKCIKHLCNFTFNIRSAISFVNRLFTISFLSKKNFKKIFFQTIFGWMCCLIAGKRSCCLGDTKNVVRKFKMAVGHGDGEWRIFNVNFLLLVHNCEWGLGISEHR